LKAGEYFSRVLSSGLESGMKIKTNNEHNGTFACKTDKRVHCMWEKSSLPVSDVSKRRLGINKIKFKNVKHKEPKDLRENPVSVFFAAVV
jgi:hypothetical protein